MTIVLQITNTNEGGEHNARVHKCHMTPDGIHVEDGIILEPGESTHVTIWKGVKVAIEEEYEVVHPMSGAL